MKFNLYAMAAAMFCCLSCVTVDPELGGNLIPADQTYNIYPLEEPLPAGAVSMLQADSLSGFSQTRITIGAVRDDVYGLTTRSCAMTLVPALDTLDFGNLKAVKVQRFHFAAAFDTLSFARRDQQHIIQNVRVHALSAPMSPAKDYDINGSTVKVDYSKSIVDGNPVVSGTDSLTFDFTEEYARRFLAITQDDMSDFSKYLKRIPGIIISTDNPIGEGGRINMFELQVGYDSNVKYVVGNNAHLTLKCDYDYDGVPETDTTFFFAYGLNAFSTLDSLFSATTRGNYPEYCLNLTTQETAALAGPAKDKVLIEGGGGLKPVISALSLKHMAEDMIRSKGGEPAEAVINKATLVLSFPFPDDYRDMFKYPAVLSPTCRIRQNDTTVVFAGLTDSSSDSENHGDINRSRLCYSPDITYHLQELLKINETPSADEKSNEVFKRKKLFGGEYDIWLIINAMEVVENSNSTSDMDAYYQMLAYQQYYNNMYYGGYGGYGGYGYGGYGYGGYGYGGYGDYYSNYYTYALLSQYAQASSSSSKSTTEMLDKDRYYCASLYGPECSDPELRPRLELTFSLSKK
ncbi:MAG: hypothetical protein J5632_04405 [Bacteroidales bacterium]|nr:hypothetical protein [Bacteroidales bacterium]